MKAVVLSKVEAKTALKIPLYQSRVSAGFPSPADDFIEKRIDLNEHLIHNPSSTYLVRASGESMKEAGIFPGDVLVVDRSKRPEHNAVVIASIDGELLVKRLKKSKGKIWLMAENPDYPPIEMTDENELMIWGVVTNVIHNLE